MRNSGRKARAKRRFPQSIRLATSLAVFAVLFAFLARSNYAFADEPLPAVRIAETLHAGCPTSPPMLERLQAHLPRLREPRAGGPAIELQFHTELRGGLSHGRLIVGAYGAKDERVASSPSCEDVLGALAMMAVIAIGEEAAAHEPSIDRRPTPARRSAAPAERTSVQSPPARGRRFTFAVGSGFEINGNHGGVWMPNGFLQLGVPLPLDPFLRVGVARSMRERVASPTGSIGIRWSEVTIAACADLLQKKELRIGPCLNAELGRLEAAVLVPPPVRSFSYFWASAGASAWASWRLLPVLSVDMMAGLRAPFVRSELFFEPSTEIVYQAPPLVPFVAASAVAHFP